MTRGNRPTESVGANVEETARDTGHRRDPLGGGEGFVARGTRFAVGVALIGAAGLAAAVNPHGEDARDRDDAGSDRPRGTLVGRELVPLATAAVLATAAAIERPASAAARVAHGAVRTAVNVARLSPLQAPVDRARSRLDAVAERGQAEGEAGVERVQQAWAALLEQLVREVLRHVDIDDLVETIDVDAVVERINVGRIVERVDLEQIVDRIDLDAVAERIDVQAIVRRIDLAGIAREVLDEIQVEDLIRESSGTLAVQTVDALRERGVDADRRLAHFVDRLLLRKHDRDVAIAEGRGTAAGTPVAEEDRTQ